MKRQDGLNIAVIGSGVSGLSAAWLLNQSHSVTLYEQANRIGGHSNTVSAAVAWQTIPVDMGFIVYNQKTYPNLTALFDHLRVPTQNRICHFRFPSTKGGSNTPAPD